MVVRREHGREFYFTKFNNSNNNKKNIFCNTGNFATQTVIRVYKFTSSLLQCRGRRQSAEVVFRRSLLNDNTGVGVAMGC